VGDPTLHRFFVLHFALPFVMVALVIGHIVLLHSYGSSNPLGVNRDVGRVPFHPYFTVKDLVGVGVAFGALAVLVLVLPHLTTEPDNFIEANPLVTPTHIKPE
jgi:ubiquinol-cytochrome c reductase cytochrome b subunit